jgi:hypothetical protein
MIQAIFRVTDRQSLGALFGSALLVVSTNTLLFGQTNVERAALFDTLLYGRLLGGSEDDRGIGITDTGSLGTCFVYNTTSPDVETVSPFQNTPGGGFEPGWSHSWQLDFDAGRAWT